LIKKVNFERLKGLAGSTWFDLAVVFLVGLLPIFWFRGSLIAGVDLPWPLASPQYLVKTAASGWNPSLCLGTADVSFRSAVYFLAGLSLSKLGLNGVTAEKLCFIFCFAGAGLSMYALLRVLVPGRRLAALGAALFYMLNPYTMVVRWYELNLWIFFYTLIPLLLAMFALSLRTGRKMHMAGFLLVSLLITMSHANLGSVVMVALVLGGYLATYLVLNRRSREKIKKALACTLILAVLWLGISGWWILPSLASLRQEASFRQKTETTMELVEMTSRDSTWDRVLRLRGYWAFNEEYMGSGDPLFTYAGSYNRAYIDILGWLIPALGLAGLWGARRHKELFWPGILWLGSLFFMKGLQPPLGGLTRWIFESIPGMSIFRHPFDKFGMLALLGLAPLVGMGLDGLYRLIRSRIGKRTTGIACGAAVCAAAAVILLVVLVWPMWTGEVIYGGGEVMPSYRVREIPYAYRQAVSWLEEQRGESFRILPLPYNRSFWTLALFDWYQGSDPSRMILESDLATPSSGYFGGDVAEQAAYGVLTGEDCGRSLCRLLNVKYLMLRKDVNWEMLSGDIRATQNGVKDECIYTLLPEMRRSLDGLDWLEPVADFGDLAFYLNRDWRPGAVRAEGYCRAVGAHAENVLVTGGPGDGEDRNGAPLWQPLGEVEWEEDGENGVTVTSLSDGSGSGVGVMKSFRLGDASLTYSYRIKTVKAAEAHLYIQWRDAAGSPLSTYLLEPGLSGDTDWTERSGFLLKPPEAKSADLVLLMEPRQGARMEVKDLFLGEQSWIKALCSEASGEGTDKASSQEDRVLLSADDARMLGLPPGEAPGLELSRPVLTLEDSRPWSAKVKVKTDGPCFLVLNQAYDAGWQAYRGSPGWLKALTSSGDLQAYHLMVNGYANAWFIKEAGEYEVTLYYRPQTLLYLGVIISAVAWALFAAWCVLGRGGRWERLKRWIRKVRRKPISEAGSEDA